MSQKDIIESLRNRMTNQSDFEILFQNADATPTEKHTAVGRHARDIKEFIERIEPIQDDEDFYSMIAMQYIHIKSLWTQINNMINHKAVAGIDSDMSELLYGGLTSNFLNVLESHIDPTIIEEILTLLSKPMAQIISKK